jgi:hypothetical protein
MRGSGRVAYRPYLISDAIVTRIAFRRPAAPRQDRSSRPSHVVRERAIRQRLRQVDAADLLGAVGSASVRATRSTR